MRSNAPHICHRRSLSSQERYFKTALSSAVCGVLLRLSRQWSQPCLIHDRTAKRPRRRCARARQHPASRGPRRAASESDTVHIGAVSPVGWRRCGKRGCSSGGLGDVQPLPPDLRPQRRRQGGGVAKGWRVRGARSPSTTARRGTKLRRGQELEDSSIDWESGSALSLEGSL